VCEVTMIRLDLAKTVLQAHGADASGAVVFHKKLILNPETGPDRGQFFRHSERITEEYHEEEKIYG
jgi:hypothetical protein